MALTVGELVGYLRLQDRDWRKGLRRAHAGLDNLGDAVARTGKVAGLTVLASSLMQVTAAAAPAAGALLALPAAGAVAAAGFATVSVAAAGMGDAFKAVAEGDAAALEEALQGMAPAAQAFVRAWAGVREQFQGVQQAVQGNLFAGLDTRLQNLAGHWLPTLQSELGDTATALNLLAKDSAATAQSPFFTSKMTSVLDQSGEMFYALRNAGGDALTVIAALADAGMELVGSMVNATASGLSSAAAWVKSAEGAATLSRWVDQARETLSQLGDIGGNLLSGLAGVFGASAESGTRLLDTLVRLTDQFATWANSAEGQQQLAMWFGVIADVAQRVSTIMPMVLGVVAQLASVFNSLPAPLQSAVTSILAWSVVLGPVAGKVRTLTKAAQKVGPVVLKVGKIGLKVGGFFLKMGARALIGGARVAAGLVLAMGPVGWVIAAVVGLVALIIWQWDRVKKWTGQAWDWVWGKIKWVWGVITDWIGRQVARVLSIIGWFEKLPGRVGAWFQGVKDAAVRKAAALVAWMVGLPDRIMDALGDLGSLLIDAGKNLIRGLIDGIDAAVDWLKDKLSSVTALIPDWKGPLSRDRRLLQPAGSAIMRGLVDGIEGERGRLRSTLDSVTGDVTAGGRMNAGQLAAGGGDAGSLIGTFAPTVYGDRGGTRELVDALTWELRKRRRGGVHRG